MSICGIYGLRQIDQSLTRRIGLKIVDEELNPTNGGSCDNSSKVRVEVPGCIRFVDRMLAKEEGGWLAATAPV